MLLMLVTTAAYWTIAPLLAIYDCWSVSDAAYLDPNLIFAVATYATGRTAIPWAAAMSLWLALWAICPADTPRLPSGPSH